MSAWMLNVSQRCSETFSKSGIEMTLGGEPTFVPLKPDGAEWSYSAVGPTKLRYARKLAANLLRRHLKGGVDFFCPGKSYPGELNPRWAIRILANRDGSPIFRARSHAAPTKSSLDTFRKLVATGLNANAKWKRLPDPLDRESQAWALLVDDVDGEWKTFPWPTGKLELTSAQGPAGLRLPLHVLAPEIPRRALTLEWKASGLSIFMPPLLQAPFVAMLAIIENALRDSGIGRVEMQGYTPADESLSWIQLGLTADPGVLEINLPACAGWEEYDHWIRTVTRAAEECGLRSWKKQSGSHAGGTGGGNHLLWGGPDLDRNPFFSRPGWLTSILRYWQHHPSLAYLFTGCYVGASSQAPRADESARDRYDLEMALSFLESLPDGDHRHLISETLRHLQTDVTGNSHRSEISLDKFWNVGWPAGTLGLIEFRAIESLPEAGWMSAVALLWSALAAWLLKNPQRGKLRDFSGDLHDRFFLPAILWQDLAHVLSDLLAGGFPMDENLFRKIWEWKFPALLHVRGFAIRKAHESWPLLCETPVDGGTTSRFVDTSMERLEFVADREFFESHEIRINNRPLELKKIAGGMFIAGLRYRRTNLYPSLHPGLPPQVPLEVALLSAKRSRRYVLAPKECVFRSAGPAQAPAADKPCKPGQRGDLTYDLRIP
ncbi:MAG: transglutaminase family protein [Verrucomicrobia bacterium]|nr:transglutaminase family protein [Verrucomicrobiota bacterium]